MGKKRKKKRERKEGRRKNCGERSRTEARGLDRCRGKSSSTELLLTGGRTLTGAARVPVQAFKSPINSPTVLLDQSLRLDKIILISPREKGGTRFSLLANLVIYAMRG